MWRNAARQTGANEAPLAAPRKWGNATLGGGGPPPPSRFDQGGGGGFNNGGGGFNGGPPRFDDRGPSRFDDRGPSRFDDRGPPPTQVPYVAPSAPVAQAKLPPAIAAAIEEAKKKKAAEDAASASTAGEGPKKKKSRWGTEKVEVSGMPTAINSNVPRTELESYAISLRLEEINKKLRMGDYVPNERDRSPSPEPQYDSHGRRTNTREVRYRKKLETERNNLVEKAMRNDPMFRPPQEYLATRKMGGRPQEKVFIPVKEFPEINFFGLLVGPRGNSLKKMERESGAKISIRGKGSVKEGKSRPDGIWGSTDDDNEDLHCLVVAETDDKVRKCVELINSVIEIAASTPEGDNDHKRNQLRELAQLNGTLRDDENQVCQNCGNIGHRKYDCPEQRNFTANIICRTCGQAGHMARDCMQRKNMQPGMPGQMPQQNPGFGNPNQTSAQFDSDYASLMAELGEMPVGGDAGANGGQGPVPSSTIPPWRIPSNWHPPQVPNRPQNTGYTNYGTGQFGAAAYGAAGYGYPGAGGYPQAQMA